MPKDLFYFNHIDPAINEGKLKELKELYKYYCKLWWCYKKAVKQFKRANLAINIASVGLITSGTIAGAIPLNPIIIGVITGLGLFVKTTSEIKKYANKIELFKLGLTTYGKTLVDLRSFLAPAAGPLFVSSRPFIKGSLSTSVLCGRVLLFSSGKLDFPTTAEKETFYPCRERVAIQGFRTEDFSIPSVTVSDASSTI